MRALIYTRVATKRQAEKSGPNRQEKACRVFCTQKGWEVVGVWHEIGSAGDGWKYLPTLYDLVTTILPQQQPAMLVAEDIGRFSQAGGADTVEFSETVHRHGGQVASPQFEDPEVVRMMSELYTLSLRMSRRGGGIDDDPDKP